MKIKNIYLIISVFLLLCSIAIAVPVKITEPHTRFNPWLDECVYFFTFGQCFVDTAYCSMDYGASALEDTMIVLDRDEVCIYNREEYHKFLEAKKKGSDVSAKDFNSEDLEEKEAEIKKDIEFIISETEKIALLPDGYDPDEDVIKYDFSLPINEGGEWQTDYGDAGEYTITVTASDGDLSSTKEAKIIVNKKEEAPTIEGFSPTEDEVGIDENSNIGFVIVVEDKNKDKLDYIWKLDGDEVSKDDEYIYDADYNSAGEHTIEVIVTDGSTEVSREWDIEVENINREPSLEPIPSIWTEEKGKVVIEPKASDEDGDELVIGVEGGKFDRDESEFIWETDFDDAGEYVITVSVSDYVSEVSQKVNVVISNVNRPPVIIDIVKG